MTHSPLAAAPKASPAARERESRASETPEKPTPLNDNQAPLIQVDGLRKSYRTARGELCLFENLDLKVEAGEMVAIVGSRGRGKALFCTFWARLMCLPQGRYT